MYYIVAMPMKIKQRTFTILAIITNMITNYKIELFLQYHVLETVVSK